MLIAFEVVALLVVFPLALWFRRAKSRPGRAVWRGLGRLARRRGLAGLLIGLLPIAGGAAVSAVAGMPEPHIHDEFSFLLQADTFAHGRLTNPPHPMWIYFETFHVIQQPTYASKYPPLQGLALAGGQVLTGLPIVGVWVSLGLACAAIYWMMLAWLPPRWALLGGLLAAVRLTFFLRSDVGERFGYWSQSYWGGAIAALGGALLFGALRRLLRRPSVGSALLLGLGEAVLANTRPFEGLVACLPAGAVLVAWVVGRQRPAPGVLLLRVALPALAVLVAAAGAMGYYNARVTGSATRMPYQVHEDAYAIVPLFLWQRLRPEPSYNHKPLRDWHADFGKVWYQKQQSLGGLATVAARKTLSLGNEYLGLVLVIPLLTMKYILRNRWMRFAALTCGVALVAVLQETWWTLPHYLAPVAPLLYLLVIQGVRHLRLWRWRGRPAGRTLVRAMPVVIALGVAVSLLPGVRGDAGRLPGRRAEVLRELQAYGGRHLVIVHYAPQHNAHEEWVYNGADIDGAAVVWARDMGDERNRPLLAYFADRRVWRLDADADPPRLVAYPSERVTTGGD
jgi:hypothetical protein